MYRPDADDLGRDVFSRLIYGAPATVYASLLAVGVAVLIGLPVGLMLVGRMFEESTIYRAAHAFEQAGDWKKM